jgi:hypothetical protein
MSEEFVVPIHADTEPAEEEIADCEALLGEMDQETQRVVESSNMALRHVARGMIGMVGIAVSVLEGMGVTLDPVSQAIIGCITSTASALMAMATAMASNPFTAIFAGITAGAAISLSTITLAAAITGTDRSKQELKQAQNILRLLHSGITLGRAGGW